MNEAPEDGGSRAAEQPAVAGSAPVAPAAPAAAPKVSRARVVLIALLAVGVVIGGAAGVTAFALRGSNDVLTEMVPGDADVYATVFLDPSLRHKLALHGLIKRFPATATRGTVEREVDTFLHGALGGATLSFATGVKPWLGSQVGVVAKAEGTSSGAALLVASKDDGAAFGALARLRAALSRGGDRWTTQIHAGVTVSAGTPRFGSPDVVALVSHTVVLGSSTGLVDEIIDTAHGGRPSISSSREYRTLMGDLPKDRLAFAFVDAAPLVKDLERTVGLQRLAAPGSFAAIQAYRGAGVVVSAHADRLAADVSVDVDATKLSGDRGTASAAGAHLDATLAFNPNDAYGVLATGALRESARSYVAALARSDPGARPTLERYGLIGPDSVAEHLTGGGGFTVGPGSAGSALPGFAAMAATDDAVGMRRFLDAATADIGRSLAGPGATWRTETYRGVTIRYLPPPADAFVPVSPAYAVGAGMGILASSPDEVKAILDAHAGANVTSAPNYVSALADPPSGATSLLYADIEAIGRAMRDGLPPDGRASFERTVGRNMAPLGAFVMTGSRSADRRSFRLAVVFR